MSVDYTNIVNSSKSLALLKGSAKTHAYLVLGADPLLPFLAAKEFAKTLCSGADTAVLPRGDAARVQTEDINWLVGDCWIKPFDSEKKAYLIDRADTMTEQAQNKLLKTLEEPPESAVFILAASEEAKLLRTVQSRCRKVRCAAPTQSEILNCLIGNNKIDAERAEFAAAFSAGSLFLCDKILESGRYGDAADAAMRVFRNMRTSKDILAYSAGLMQYKEIAGAVLDFMSYILRDVMAVHAGGGLVFNKRRPDEIAELSASFSLPVCAAVFRRMDLAKKALYYNCAYQNVIDGLLFGMLEIKAKLSS